VKPGSDLSEKKEVRLVKTARVPLANTVAALEKGDVAGAKAAFAPYNGIWNGVEGYVVFRSRPLYEDIERNWEAKITEAFGTPQPNASEILSMARSMLASYDKAIEVSQSGPSISPIFDEVADLRVARAPLREVPAALSANDLSRAKGSFASFAQNWSGAVADESRARSAGTQTEIEQAITAVNAAWQQSGANASTLTPLVATVTNRVNYVVTLATTAARNADLSRTAPAAADTEAARGVRTMQSHLTASLASWTAGNYGEANARASEAAAPLQSDSPVLSALKARGLDAALKTAVDAYAGMAGGAGDAAQVNAANKAAIDAGELAIQGLVGQFSTDPAVQRAIS
jgi:hypothetical protein